MNRNTTCLSGKCYDVLIIGGGIYGATVAWDAASRGLSVALVDKGDFCNATSSNSQKIVHGGLRYIQHGDFQRMRESVRERTNLMRISSHLVHPMPCIIPTYGRLMQSVMPLALKIFDIVSSDRNQLKDPQKNIPNGRTISKDECLNLIPGIKEEGLTGGAIWYDGQVYNTERMVLSFIRSAQEIGVDIANYVEVLGSLKNEEQSKSIIAKDLLNNTELIIQAKVILNSTGPWIDQTINRLTDTNNNKILLSKMVLLVVNRVFSGNYAFGIPSRKEFKDQDAVIDKGYRHFFITPWRDHSLVGTAQEPFQGNPEDYKITEKDIQKFIEEVNIAYPHAALTRKDVSFFYGGLIPIDKVDRNGDIKVTKHFKIIDHEKEGINGIISLVGVKYTTARDVAEKVVDLIFKKLGKKSPKCTTNITPIYGGAIDNFNIFLENAIKKRPQELDPEVIKHLVYNYGSEYKEILNYLNENTGMSTRMGKTPIIKAEIIHGIRQEMAQKLPDIIFRRTELGTAEFPGEETLRKCAHIMADELGWDKTRIENEIGEVEAIFVAKGK
ncbi:MAG: glycerol-3-phosphate dehydrogenase/oxidase [Candidatus Methanoperedens sp.]|nr:glycerol-3-phosphate dehydrogenase/oxidase [Candidatus Methanoperedens sp.]